MTGPVERQPLTWRDVDPPTLKRLLESGLTPDAIAVLYGRSGSLVRVTARKWGLDCRALRARAIGLAITHPDIAAQFVQVVDGAPPAHGPRDLLSGSGARCQWRCQVCGAEWVTSVANRTKRKSGCPACARERGRDLARARAPKTSPLSHAAVELIDEFVSNISRPERDVTTTPSGSHDRILWRCKRGHEWETSARQRVKHATQCPTCLAGLRSSRLEFEVAELVQCATDLTVTVGAEGLRIGRAVEERVDLWIAEADLLVDLDPSRWHQSARAVARDARKLERLAGDRYVRIRPRGLGTLSVERAPQEQQVVLLGDDEKDPWEWSCGVVMALRSFQPSVAVRVPTVRARTEARARGDLRWRHLRASTRPRTLASEHPLIADQFVEALDRPGLRAADLAPAGDDRVLWRCPACGHRWEARVANRTRLGTGCPPCSFRRGAARAAVPRPGQSFAERHPQLVRFFIENQTHPGKTLFDVKPSSIDKCRWTCPHCSEPWTATPHSLNRNPGSGCRACGHRRGARKRRRTDR